MSIVEFEQYALWLALEPVARLLALGETDPEEIAVRLGLPEVTVAALLDELEQFARYSQRLPVCHLDGRRL